MFEWAMESLKSFQEHPFVFITQKKHEARPFLREKCETLGIAEYEIIEIDGLTSGQASTNMKAETVIEEDEAIAIYNIDTYAEPGVLSPDEITGDGWIPVFEKGGERWSFVRLNNAGEVIEVSEKSKISDLATIGFYYFKHWQLFADAFEKRGVETEERYGETYVAPLYNFLVERGDLVIPLQVPKERVHVLGTPRDAREFDPTFDERNGL
jgi:dTDP-glucose pyrophosphorylase